MPRSRRGYERGLRCRQLNLADVTDRRNHNARNDSAAARSEREGSAAAERKLKAADEGTEHNRKADHKHTGAIDLHQLFFFLRLRRGKLGELIIFRCDIHL